MYHFLGEINFLFFILKEKKNEKKNNFVHLCMDYLISNSIFKQKCLNNLVNRIMVI